MKTLSWIADSGLTVKVAATPMILPVEQKDLIDTHWAESQRQDPQFFRGPVLSLHSIQRDHTGWCLTTEFTDFAHYLYSREHFMPDDPYWVRVVFAAALVVSCDRQVLAGVMAEDTARPNRLQSIGGAATWEDVVDGHFDPIRSASKELQEETGLAIPQLGLVRPPQVLGCTVDPNGSVAIAVGYLSRLPMSEIMQSVALSWAKRPDPELSQVAAVALGSPGVKWLRSQSHRSVRYLERIVLELEDWGI